MKKIVTITIGFIHDFAAGCWAASVFAVYWLHRQPFMVDRLDVLIDLQKQFFHLGLASLVMVLATGAGRSFTYIDNFYGKSAENTRRRLLILKHLFLLVIFGYGTYWQYSIIF